MAPNLENREQDNVKAKIKALQQELQLRDLQRQNTRHDNEIIIGAAGFMTILSFTIHHVFFAANLLFLYRLLDYNYNHKDYLWDVQVKNYVLATLLTALPFLASDYGIPKLVTFSEYVKTLVIG